MTQVKEPGLTEEQFRKICNWLLIYAYFLLFIQLVGSVLYLTSVALNREPDNGLIHILVAFVFSMWFSNDRKKFFKRKLVNNGINGSAGIDLPFRHNVFWWSSWCLLESMGSMAVLVISAKAVFGAG